MPRPGPALLLAAVLAAAAAATAWSPGIIPACSYAWANGTGTTGVSNRYWLETPTIAISRLGLDPLATAVRVAEAGGYAYYSVNNPPVAIRGASPYFTLVIGSLDRISTQPGATGELAFLVGYTSMAIVTYTGENGTTYTRVEPQVPPYSLTRVHLVYAGLDLPQTLILYITNDSVAGVNATFYKTFDNQSLLERRDWTLAVSLMVPPGGLAYSKIAAALDDLNETINWSMGWVAGEALYESSWKPNHTLYAAVTVGYKFQAWLPVARAGDYNTAVWTLYILAGDTAVAYANVTGWPVRWLLDATPQVPGAEPYSSIYLSISADNIYVTGELGFLVWINITNGTIAGTGIRIPYDNYTAAYETIYNYLMGNVAPIVRELIETLANYTRPPGGLAGAETYTQGAPAPACSLPETAAAGAALPGELTMPGWTTWYRPPFAVNPPGTVQPLVPGPGGILMYALLLALYLWLATRMGWAEALLPMSAVLVVVGTVVDSAGMVAGGFIAAVASVILLATRR